jgi:hypothetical protein
MFPDPAVQAVRTDSAVVGPLSLWPSDDNGRPFYILNMFNEVLANTIAGGEEKQ